MDFLALKFVYDPRGTVPVQSEVKVEDLQAFDRSVWNDPSTAYVVRRDDLAALKNLKDLTEDRGVMKEHMELKRYLLRRSKIPIVQARYTKPGRLKQGVRRLLERASDRKSTRLNSSHIQKSRMPSSA